MCVAGGEGDITRGYSKELGDQLADCLVGFARFGRDSDGYFKAVADDAGQSGAAGAGDHFDP